MFCQNCGHQLGDKDKFCIECGAPVQTVESEVGTESFEAAKEPERAEQEIPVPDPGRVEPVQYGAVEPDPVWNTASSAQSAQFSENEPHYKKNTGILVGVVAGIGVLVMIILFACVTISGSQARRHIKNNTPIFNEREDEDDFDFDINESDDFWDGYDFDHDNDFGDYF